MGNKETVPTVPVVATTEEETTTRVSPLLDPMGYVASLYSGSSWTRATLAQKVPAKMTAEERQAEVANLGRNIAELKGHYNRHQEKGRYVPVSLFFLLYLPPL